MLKYFYTFFTLVCGCECESVSVCWCMFKTVWGFKDDEMQNRSAEGLKSCGFSQTSLTMYRSPLYAFRADCTQDNSS